MKLGQGRSGLGKDRGERASYGPVLALDPDGSHAPQGDHYTAKAAIAHEQVGAAAEDEILQPPFVDFPEQRDEIVAVGRIGEYVRRSPMANDVCLLSGSFLFISPLKFSSSMF
jgi:hypothetical protein